MQSSLFTEPATGVHVSTTDVFQRVPRAEALAAVSPIRRALLPVCSQIAVAGSARRGKSDVKDLEFVCVERTPGAVRHTLFEYCFQHKLNPTDFFGRCKHGTKQVNCYLQTQNGQPLKLELYLTQPRQFGYIHFIRTGPLDWNIAAMIQLGQTGHVMRNGMVIRDHHIIDCSEESTIFNLLGIPYLEPQFRDSDKTLFSALRRAGIKPHFTPKS